ncbi:hypothetical protein [Psychrobacillus sp. BM2]|uniref:hypothetical protein n=1 Tax=Psychrobacillus sp. BM2 TaxID=3400421 RepID=UPI003B028A70
MINTEGNSLLKREEKYFNQELYDFNDYKFDIEYSIEIGKDILYQEKVNKRLIKGDFEDSLWVFKDETRDTRINFDFNDIDCYSSSIDTQHEWKSIVKCWITSLLPSRSVNTVRMYYSGLKTFLLISEGFKSIQTIKDHFNHKLNERKRWGLTIYILNFLDYFEELDNNLELLSFLIQAKAEIHTPDLVGTVRILPPSKEVILFSWIIEDYFAQIDKDSQEYYKYFSIFLWWNLTNLIPMRPSEFCKLKRNCINETGNKFYIYLPRIKQKNSKNRIQVIDTIEIPQNLYLLIEDYIERTNSYGVTETLVSYASMKSKYHGKLDNNQFSLTILSYSITKFYEEVVTDKYGYSVNLNKAANKIETYDITQMVKPGDTRHFAFLNLMRQGYHPVEIARLGGHVCLHSQYHYHQHQEYWVDTEILVLMQKFSLNKRMKQQEHRTGSPIVNYQLEEEIKEKHIFRVTTSDVRHELELGYCTDLYQNCKTDCFFCDSWRISPEEYLENFQLISEEIEKCDNEVIRLANVLASLNKLALKFAFKDDEYAEFNPIFSNDLLIAKNELDTALYKATKFRNKLKS